MKSLIWMKFAGISLGLNIATSYWTVAKEQVIFEFKVITFNKVKLRRINYTPQPFFLKYFINYKTVI